MPLTKHALAYKQTRFDNGFRKLKIYINSFYHFFLNFICTIIAYSCIIPIYQTKSVPSMPSKLSQSSKRCTIPNIPSPRTLRGYANLQIYQAFLFDGIQPRLSVAFPFCIFEFLFKNSVSFSSRFLRSFGL